MTATFVPLPNLDDRRWADLVDEGRSLIPVYAPSWTDHNAHDPGITLMELLAWIAETDFYRVDRIPPSHIRAFLALVGVTQRPPVAARAAVVFTLKQGTAAPVTVPAATLLNSPAGPFRLRTDLSVLPAILTGVQVAVGGSFRDATSDWQRGRPVSLFGADPKLGDRFCLGFGAALTGGAMLCLHVALEGERAGAAERQGILDEICSRRSACNQLTRAPCGTTAPPIPAPPDLPPHHSAVVVWEMQTSPGVWQPLDTVDGTRSLTLSGQVRLALPHDVPLLSIGAIARPLAYVRARLAFGSFDAAPSALRILANATEAEQCAPTCEGWPIAAGVAATGSPPPAGEVAALRLAFDATGNVSQLAFASTPADALAVRVLTYQAATAAQPGRLVVDALRLGIGNGAPNQVWTLPGREVLQQGLAVQSLESGRMRQWRRRDSLAASGPADCDFVLDAGAATVRFGDGRNGRSPPMGAIIVFTALATAGAAGNAAAGTVSAVDTGLHNVALLGDPVAFGAQFDLIENPDSAFGGADEESLAHAEGRAAQLLTNPSRAVTLEDCEVLALGTPGTSIARAAARANLHRELPCYSAPGIITLVVVPFLPAGRPVPSSGLLAAVGEYLHRRHVIGSRIDVTGPDYLEVAVTASVKAFPGQDKTALREAVVAALTQFLDPLAGGPNGTGWPLGRDVYRSEILQVIAGVPGVDHVLSLALAVLGSGPQCGNVCLPALTLTVSGQHQIEVS